MALTTAQINDQLRKLDPDLATKYGGYFLRRDLDGPTGFFMASVLAHLPCQNFKRGLDVGSGLGHWLAILQDRTFCQMEAVEPSAEKNATAAKMLEAFGLHAVFHETTAHELVGVGDEFDIICSFGVLDDHYDDPGSFLQAAADRLRPGGYVAFNWYADEVDRKPTRSYLTRDEVLFLAPAGLTPGLVLTREYGGRTITLYVFRKTA